MISGVHNMTAYTLTQLSIENFVIETHFMGVEYVQ